MVHVQLTIDKEYHERLFRNRSRPKKLMRATKTRRRGLGIVTVRARPGRPTEGLLQAGPHVFACALGKGGIRMLKREGDGATPLAPMRLLYGYVRRDRGVRLTGPLPLKAARRDDGWCDAVDDRNYNRPVRLPYRASAEAMCRADRLYDMCIVLDFNLRPRRRGGGSAIFFHVAREGMRPTLGCVAVEPSVMRRLLPHLSARTLMRVVR